MKRMLSLLIKIGLVFLACYLLLTPEGSVRFAYMRSGNLVSAFTSDVSLQFTDTQQSIYHLQPTNNVSTAINFKTIEKYSIYWSKLLGNN